jgi:hypothetical protein
MTAFVAGQNVIRTAQSPGNFVAVNFLVELYEKEKNVNYKLNIEHQY